MERVTACQTAFPTQLSALDGVQRQGTMPYVGVPRGIMLLACASAFSAYQ